MNATHEIIFPEPGACENPVCAQEGCQQLLIEPNDDNATGLIAGAIADNCQRRQTLYSKISAVLTQESHYLPVL